MRFLTLSKCKEGMMLGRDVFDKNGVVLLKHGYPLSRSSIKALEKLGFYGVYIEDEVSKDIELVELVDDSTRLAARLAIQDLYNSTKFGNSTIASSKIDNISDIIDNIISQVLSNRKAFTNFTSLKTYNNYTYQHSVDVSVLALILGREMNLSRKQLQNLGKSAFFHDMGKLHVPKNILNKPGKLTPEEFEQIKKHTELGYALTKNSLQQTDEISLSCLFHHEKHSGEGYPNNLHGNQIPLFSKIISIADAYDAIISNRTYKKAMPAFEAHEYVMANSGIHFDPKIVSCFIKTIAPFPVGSTVKLSTGKEAIVVENRSNFPMRPVIKVLEHPDSKESEYIDLAFDMSATSITITEIL